MDLNQFNGQEDFSDEQSYKHGYGLYYAINEQIRYCLRVLRMKPSLAIIEEQKIAVDLLETLLVEKDGKYINSINIMKLKHHEKIKKFISEYGKATYAENYATLEYNYIRKKFQKLVELSVRTGLTAMQEYTDYAGVPENSAVFKKYR